MWHEIRDITQLIYKNVVVRETHCNILFAGKKLQLCHFFPNFLLKVIFLFEHENWFYVALLVKAI